MENGSIRKIIKVLLDSIVIVLAIVIPTFLKYEFAWRVNFRQVFVLLYLFIFFAGYFINGMQNRSWKYFSYRDTIDLVGINILTSALFFVLAIMLNWNITKTIIPVSFMFATLGQICLRLPFIYISQIHKLYTGKEREKVIVYGAGEAGLVLAKEAKHNIKFPYEVVGFVDDDSRKVSTEILGIRVLGKFKDLEKILDKKQVKTVIFAIPSLKEEKLQKALQEAEKIEGIKVKLVGGIGQLLQGDVQIRSIEITDLLGRKEIKVNDQGIGKFIEGKTIFITGGAGSIGSELSRQIAKHNPKRLVNIDLNENEIYFLELELRRKYPHLELVSEICSIRDYDKLDYLFEKYRPQIIFHAAAHKHVPLMEHNPEEAIKNNVFGTRNVATLAEKYKVDTMVLISTDKAVNPTNFMGASKRMCELIMEEFSKRDNDTKYCAVRFGNVLGSNGSVIPIFKQLIAEGKNLTVTHRDINRYFMTIPEAAQLVIEAGSFGKGGELFILDMGEPVKIYDLAQSMIRLSGAKVGIDIVGLRPGEKLYEELLYDVSKAMKTDNNKIFITKMEEHGEEIAPYYDQLRELANTHQVEALKDLAKKVVTTYKEV